MDGRTAKGALTRAAILHLATKVACRHGVMAVTYQSVARALELTTGAIQGHFHSVDDLRALVIVEWSRELLVRAIEPSERFTGLRRVWRLCEDWIVESDVLRIPFEILGDDVRGEAAAALLATLDTWCERIRRGLRQVVLRAELPEQADLLALASALQGTLVALEWNTAILGREEAALTAGRAAYSVLFLAVNAAGRGALPDREEALASIRRRLSWRKRPDGTYQYEGGRTALADASSQPAWRRDGDPASPEYVQLERKELEVRAEREAATNAPLHPEREIDLDAACRAAMRAAIEGRKKQVPVHPGPFEPPPIKNPAFATAERQYYEDLYAQQVAKYEADLAELAEAERAALAGQAAASSQAGGAGSQ